MAEAMRLLERLGLGSPALHRRPATGLSVGQQQRVAVARALIGNPPIVIADEPTSALDGPRRREFLALLLEEVAQAGSALLFVSHDPALAQDFDRVLTLDGGAPACPAAARLAGWAVHPDEEREPWATPRRSPSACAR